MAIHFWIYIKRIKEAGSWRNIYIPRFIATYSTIARRWSNSNVTKGWMKQRKCIIYIQLNIMQSWKEGGWTLDVKQSEISQSEKINAVWFPCMRYLSSQIHWNATQWWLPGATKRRNGSQFCKFWKGFWESFAQCEYNQHLKAILKNS